MRTGTATWPGWPCARPPRRPVSPVCRSRSHRSISTSTWSNRPPKDPHEHHDVRYLVVAPPGAEAVGNHESREIRWVDAAELPGMGVDRGLVRLAERALIRLAALECGG